jgi:hypothetical protein
LAQFYVPRYLRVPCEFFAERAALEKSASCLRNLLNAFLSPSHRIYVQFVVIGSNDSASGSQLAFLMA